MIKYFMRIWICTVLQDPKTEAVSGRKNDFIGNSR